MTTPPPTKPSDDLPPQEVRVQVELHIPLRTFLAIFAALLAAGAACVLWPLLLLVFLALFLAVTLQAAVDKLVSRGMKPRSGVLLVACSLLLVLGLGLAFVVPVLLEQVAAFGEALPGLHKTALRQLPLSESMRGRITNALQDQHWSEFGASSSRLWTAGGIGLGVVSQLVFLVTIALYLLVDGKNVGDWLLAFFSPLHRSKLRTTGREVSKVIFGYVSGQLVTSLIVTACTFGILTAFRVPSALMLAILAGVVDVVPILGFFLAAAPAFLLALSVSPQTGYLVLASYLLFHAIEAYFIIPRVYGKSLRVATLTVLLGLLAGALLAGIPGSLAALPIIASYAAVERIWLKPFLREGVSEKHELQKDEVFGDRL